jgi:hypothetical protein
MARMVDGEACGEVRSERGIMSFHHQLDDGLAVLPLREGAQWVLSEAGRPLGDRILG